MVLHETSDELNTAGHVKVAGVECSSTHLSKVSAMDHSSSSWLSSKVAPLETREKYTSRKVEVDRDALDTTQLPGELLEKDCHSSDANGVYSVELKDDLSLRTVTVRSCMVGVVMGVLGASVAQLFIYKPVALHVPALFIQLMCFLIGSGLSKIPGPEWWNPGPFSSKETGFASILAVSASIDAIAVLLLSAQDLYFQNRVSVGLALATMMSSQLIGYGWAGVLRPLLIYPADTPYPSMLPSVALIRSLAGRDSVTRDQLKFFKKAIWVISIYEIFPSYIAPALQAISPWCLTLPQSPIVTQIFGGSQVTEGLGLFALSFDWATLSSFGPLYTPFDAQVTQWVGVLLSIFLFMAGYRYNWFGGGIQSGFPFMSATLVNATGGVYDLTSAVFANGTENKATVEKMGVPLMATTSILAKTFTCVAASSAFSSAFLYHWRDMKAILMRSGRTSTKEDPHRTIVKSYREFPAYGIWTILLASSVAALLVSHYSQSGLSVFGMLIALLLSGLVSISAGFIFASTGVVLSIMPPIQLFGGLVFPGNALVNFWFTTFASTSAYQCLNILKELKLGQYLLLSPMSVIGGQLAGSIFGTFANYLVMEIILKNERDVLLLPNGNGVLTGIHILGYESQAISWGVFAKHLYTPGKIYAIVVYGAIAGLFAPIPFFLLHKWRPSMGFDRFNFTVFASSIPSLAGTLSSGQMTAIALGTWSQFYMRKYRTKWFFKYNNILNAALLGGTEITILILLIFFQGGAGWKVKMPHYFLNPKGPPDYCEVKS